MTVRRAAVLSFVGLEPLEATHERTNARDLFDFVVRPGPATGRQAETRHARAPFLALRCCFVRRQPFLLVPLGTMKR